MNEIEQAIDWLKNEKIAYEIESDDAESQAYENEDAQVIRETYNRLARLTGIAIKALQDQQWIKASDRLPQREKDVLALDDCGEVQIASYGRLLNAWFRSGFMKCTIVTHWQELPKYPKEANYD